MTTKLVSNEAAAVQALVESAKAQVGALDAAYAARAQALHQPPATFTLGQVLSALCAYAAAAAQDANAKDQSHGLDKNGEKAPHAVRDDNQRNLLATLREVRGQLLRQFKASDVAVVFPTWPLSDVAGQLASQATQVAQALPRTVPTWTAQHNVLSPVNPQLAASTILSQATALQTSTQASDVGHGVASASGAERNLSQQRMHDARKGLLHVAEGLLELAGLHDQADKLVEKHHVGKPRGANGEAPAANTAG